MQPCSTTEGMDTTYPPLAGLIVQPFKILIIPLPLRVENFSICIFRVFVKVLLHCHGIAIVIPFHVVAHQFWIGAFMLRWGGDWYYPPDPVHGCMVCSDASDGPPPTHIHLSTCLCCLCCLCCLLVTSVRPRSVNSINSPSPTANKSEQAMCTITRVFSFSFTVYMPGGQPGRCVP